MQIVIEIPEKTVNEIKDNAMFAGTIPSEILWDVTSAIVNGIPLPKGHGRIIDESKITCCEQNEYLMKLITNAPTIIKAERKDEE